MGIINDLMVIINAPTQYILCNLIVISNMKRLLDVLILEKTNKIIIELKH